jgi:lysozyme
MDYSKETLVAELIRDEGVELKPYRCTAGKLTIGVGRNIEDRGITRDEASYLLKNDIASCEKDLDRTVPKWRELSDARQRVLLNMMFNLGVARFSGFQKFIANIRLGDFSAAAREMMDSSWSRQVGQRAVRLRDMMERG